MCYVTVCACVCVCLSCVSPNRLRSCIKYSAWTSQTSTTLNAVLLRDDSNCKGHRGLGVGAAIAGGVVFAMVIVVIVALLLLLKFGVLRPSSFMMLAKGDTDRL